MALTIEEKEWCEKLALAGETASRIAMKFNAEFKRSITRNVVIGVISRRGNVKLGAQDGARKTRAANRMRNAKSRQRAPRIGYASPATTPTVKTPLPLPKENDVPGTLYTLFDRPANGCQWFYGDPQVTARGYCGCDKVPGLPYCGGHARRAYEVPEIKTRRTVHHAMTDAAELAAVKEAIAMKLATVE